MLASFLTLAIFFVNFIDNSQNYNSPEEFNKYLSSYSKDIDNLNKNNFPHINDDNFEQVLESSSFVENSDSKLFHIKGIASHYASRFHGRTTANGEVYDMYDFSAASKTLPFGTIIKVINKQNGKSTLVRVNDRGPYTHNRILDLSFSAAKKIGNLGLPKINIIGFDSKTLTNTDSESQFLAFSADKKFQILNKELVNIKSSFDDFSQAMATYYKLKSEASINNVYIFIPASKDYYNTEKFFVGTIDNTQLLLSSR